MAFDKFKFLKKIDYFGVQQTFRVNSSFKYTSRFGGFVFFSYLLFAISYFFYSFKSYVRKEIKNVIMSEQVIVPAPDLNLQQMNFTIAFGITFDSDGSYAIDKLKEFLEFSLNHVSLAGGKKLKQKVPVRNCSYDDFPFADRKTFDLQDLASYQCPNRTNYTLSGIYSDPVFSYFEYTIALKKKFFSSESLKQLFMDNPLKLNVFFTDIALDMDDLNNAKRLYLNSITNYVVFDNYQKHNLDFILLNFTDDGSILFEQPEISSFVKFHSERIYFFPLEQRDETTNEDNNKLYRIYVRTNQQVKGIKREFQKLPAFIANVSGIMSNVLVFMFIIINFINEFKLKQSLINRLFNFKDHIIQKEKIMDKIEKIVEESYMNKGGGTYTNNANNASHAYYDANLSVASEHNQSSNFHSEKSEMNPSDLEEPTTPDSRKKKPNLDQKDSSRKNLPYMHKLRTRKINPQFFKDKINSKDKYSYKHAFNSNNFLGEDQYGLKRSQTSKPLQFSFCELIYSFFCCSPEYLKFRKEIYQKGRNKLHYYLDVLTLIKKFQEFDIVKSLIFSKEQLAILNFLSKPIVSIAPQKKNQGVTGENEDFSNSVLKDQQINQDEVDNLYKSYVKLKRKSKADKTDQDLINRLETKLKQIVLEE